MNGNQNLNIDAQTLEQCLKSVSDFGGTTYQNICTGASNYISWGSADWMLAIILSSFGITFVLLLIVMFFKMIFDY